MGWGPNLFIQLGQPMKTLAATTALLGLALLPSAALADWNGYYGGISTGMSSNGEIEVSNSLSDDGVYPLDDSTTFGGYLGSLTQSGNVVYGGEIELVFASDAQFASDITLEDPTIDLKGKVGFAVDRFLAYGVLGVSATNATFGPNDINGSGFVVGAGLDFMVTDNIIFGAEYLTRSTISEEFLDADVDIKLDTIAVRASYKF